MAHRPSDAQIPEAQSAPCNCGERKTEPRRETQGHDFEAAPHPFTPSLPMSASIGIYVFPEVEVLDFAGPFEVFTTASRIAARRSPGTPAPFSVFSVASREGPVRTRAGLIVQPDFTFTNHPPIDLLIVPGGVVTAEQAKPEVLRWLQETSVAARITASVCTGVFLLAQGGIVRAHRVTTHWEDINDLRSQFPDYRSSSICAGLTTAST